MAGDRHSQIEKQVVVSAFSAGRELWRQLGRVATATGGRGYGGEVICYQKVPKQSILNQSLDPPPPPHQKFLDPPLYWRGIR